MSSTGQIVGGIVGAVIGFMVGGPAGSAAAMKGMMVGASIGMTAGSLLLPPKGPHLVGPRLEDLSVQTSTYGANIPRLRGKIATFGNVFWLQGDALTEVAVSEEVGGKGGSSSTSTTFEYFATFAVGFGKGPVDGIGRIWIAGNLKYDGTSTDPNTIAAGNELSFTFYPGNDTQLPDPSIQADKGVDNTPAYRGLAYIVFHDLPLKDYGNSLVGAQVKVEVIVNGETSTVFTALSSAPTGDEAEGIAVSGDFAYVLTDNSKLFQVFNIANPSNIFKVGQLSTARDSIDNALIVVGNYVYGLVGTTLYKYVQVFDVSEPTAPVSSSLTEVNGSPKAIAISGNYLYVVHESTAAALLIFDISLVTPSLVGSITTDTYARGVAADGNYVYVVSRGSNVLQTYDVSDPAVPVQVHSVATGTTPTHIELYGDYLHVLHFTTPATLKIYSLVDPAAPALVSTTATATYGRDIVIQGQYAYIVSEGAPRLQIFDISDPTSPVSAGSTSTGLSAPVDIALSGDYVYVVDRTLNTIKSLFFADEILTPVYPTLAEIVSAECLSSKLLTADDIDVTELTPTVNGYKVATVAAIRAAIEPLQSSWPFDVVQHGYQILFKMRGSASVATIAESELDARDAGSEPGVRITNTREMDAILPCKVVLKYLDVNREYDNGEQYAERINTDAINVLSVDLPLALSATEAAQKAETLLYLYWLERYDVAITLPPTYQHLEPGAVITVTAETATYSLRLTSIQYLPNGRLECSAKYNSAAIYTPAAAGESGLVVGPTLTLCGSTVYDLLDIPCLLDVFNSPGFPLAMTGFLSGWPGGTLYRSSDLLTWSPIQGVTSPGAVMGVALTTLAAHPGTLIDKAGSLTARLYQGSLSSITEGGMLNGSNHFAYGLNGRWEIIAAQTCVLQADGTYILTDLLRGRYGTEWASGVHAVGDHLVLLNTTALKWIGMDTDAIGLERNYRGVTLGKDVSSDTNKAFTYQGVNLECLSPVYLNGSRHPSTNDWILTWIRRTRVGGEWRSYVDATLGESSEAYEVDVFSSNTYATLKRTLSVTSAAAAYTSAQQVTDFGSNQATLYLRIYQMSATMGRGYYLQTSITR